MSPSGTTGSLLPVLTPVGAFTSSAISSFTGGREIVFSRHTVCHLRKAHLARQLKAYCERQSIPKDCRRSVVKCSFSGGKQHTVGHDTTNSGTVRFVSEEETIAVPPFLEANVRGSLLCMGYVAPAIALNFRKLNHLVAGSPRHSTPASFDKSRNQPPVSC